MRYAKVLYRSDYGVIKKRGALTYSLLVIYRDKKCIFIKWHRLL